MAGQKKKAGAATGAATKETAANTKEVAMVAFIEHAHVQEVYVHETTGDFYLHAPNAKRKDFDKYVKVTREEVEGETAEA